MDQVYKLKEPISHIGKEKLMELKNKDLSNIKPTSAGVIELSEQLQAKNPRHEKPVIDEKKKMVIADTDIINLVAQTKSSFQTIPSDLDDTNLYSME